MNIRRKIQLRVIILACIALAWQSILVNATRAEISTGYSYDLVGNRVGVTDLIHFPDPAVFGFDPPAANHGQRVNIFGRNLPPGDGVGIGVTFNGISASIVVVAPNVLTVVVPAGAASGPVVVTLPAADPVDLGEFAVQGVVITPGSGFYLIDQPVQFSAQVVGEMDQSVTWDLFYPPPAGDPPLTLNPGTVSPEGLYSPPASNDVSAAPQVFIRATSEAQPTSSSMVAVRLFGTVIQQPPVMVLAPGPGDVDGLSPNTTVAFPTVMALVPGSGDVNGLGPNTTMAFPPLTTLVTAPGDVDGIGPNTTVGYPPVEVCGPPCGPPGDPCEPVECPE